MEKNKNINVIKDLNGKDDIFMLFLIVRHDVNGKNICTML